MRNDAAKKGQGLRNGGWPSASCVYSAFGGDELTFLRASPATSPEVLCFQRGFRGKLFVASNADGSLRWSSASKARSLASAYRNCCTNMILLPTSNCGKTR